MDAATSAGDEDELDEPPDEQESAKAPEQDQSAQAPEQDEPLQLPGEDAPTAHDLEDSIDPLRMLMQSLKSPAGATPKLADAIEEEDQALSVDINLDDDEDDEDATVITEIGADIAQELLSRKTFSQVLRQIGPVDDEDDWDQSSSASRPTPAKDGQGTTSEMDSPLDLEPRKGRNTIVHDDD